MKSNYTVVHVNLAKGWRGGENQTFLLIKNLHADGIDQCLIASKTSALYSAVASLKGVKIFTPLKALLVPNILPRNAITHAHEARGVYIAYALKKLSGIPYIITRRMDRQPKKRLLTRAAYSCAAAHVAISAAAKDAIESFLPSSRPEIIASCYSEEVPIADASASIKSAFIGNKHFLIGHAGALVNSDKGQSTLIKAAEILERRGESISLVFFGEGPDQRDLENQAKNLQSVHFPGHVSPVINYLAALDVFIFPSRKEGLGSVLLDVMRCGTPIVAARTGGIPDLIEHGSSGLLCPPNDPLSFADQIQSLFDNENLRKSVIKNAKKASEDYSPNRMVNKYKNLYKKITQ